MTNFKSNTSFLIHVRSEKEFHTAFEVLAALGYDVTPHAREKVWQGQEYVKFGTMHDYIWASSMFDDHYDQFQDLQAFLQSRVSAPETEALRAEIAQKEKELEQLRKQLENM